MKVRVTDILGSWLEEDGMDTDFKNTFEINGLKDIFEVEEYFDNKVGKCLSFTDSNGRRNILHPDSVIVIEG